MKINTFVLFALLFTIPSVAIQLDNPYIVPSILHSQDTVSKAYIIGKIVKDKIYIKNSNLIISKKGVKVINNSTGKPQIVELTYKNNKLIQIILR